MTSGSNTVRNNNLWHTLVHKRTDLQWEKIYSNLTFNYMRFRIDGVTTSIREGNDTTPPTEGIVDIDFLPGATGRYDVDFNNANQPYLAGSFTVDFTFEFPVTGLTCTVSRSVTKATATPTPTVTPTPTPVPADCGDVYFDSLAPYSWYMRGLLHNDSALYSAEIIRTRFDWFQPDPATNVDCFSGNNMSSYYWSTNNANPRCWSSPCEYFRGDVGWNAANSVIPTTTARYWAVDLDGPGQQDFFGSYQVCVDIEFNDVADTVCPNICASYGRRRDSDPVEHPDDHANADDHQHPDDHANADQHLHADQYVHTDEYADDHEHADDHQHADDHEHADDYEYTHDHADADANVHPDEYPDADPDADPVEHADDHTDAYAVEHADDHQHAVEHPDADADEHAFEHADRHSDVDADEYADEHADIHADVDADEHADEHADIHADAYTDQHPDADQHLDAD